MIVSYFSMNNYSFTMFNFQFFHEGKEYDKWMPAELSKHISLLDGATHDENDGHRLLITLKETLAVFLHWQSKINALFEKSRKIVPVHFRTKPLDHFRPVTSLCDYKTNEVCCLLFI